MDFPDPEIAQRGLRSSPDAPSTGDLRKLQGVETNEMTFTGALTACRHGGLIEEACEIFKSMEMTPSPEHRNLMMDILGRMLDGMPAKGRQNTWNALISGAHTEEDIRGSIGRHVDSVAESAHVTVSNALAGLGRWDDSALVREAARRGRSPE